MNKISKPFYLGSIVGGICGGFISFLIAIIILIFSMNGEIPLYPDFTLIIPGIILMVLGYLLYIYSTVIFCILLYKSWQQIQDNQARTTPGKAVGFTFIPFFNFYWIFVSYWGFARDYNKYIQRTQLNIPVLNEPLFLTYCILILCTMVPYIGSLVMIACLVFEIMVSNKMINAVNNIREIQGTPVPA
jgi:hypothetical protein